ncbi:MAG: NlpC/P60 family protein [Lachnospiraceae bacterium]|nr:NlpC/P60 family protein [Lachnospiraceae bacterium]
MHFKKVYKLLVLTLSLALIVPYSAYASDNTGIPAVVEGDTNVTPTPPAVPTPPTVPTTPTDSGSSTGTTNPGTTDPGTTDPGTTDPGTTDPGTTDPGTTDPGTTDPGTTDPGTTDPGTTDPGTTDPGTTDPGTTDPGTTDPGTTDPGTTDPGTTDPGTTDPGTTDPGTTDPGTTDPSVPVTPTPPAVQPPAATTDSSEESTTTPNNTYSSNESLISNNTIYPVPSIETSFRFATVEKDYAISNVDTLNFMESQEDNARIVGTLDKDGLLFILKDIDDTWVYAESGVVRGFVKKADLIMDTDADAKVEETKEENFTLATASVDPTENTALTFTKTTVRQTVIDKVYAISTIEDLNVREETNTEARVIGTLPKDALCYIISDVDKDWYFVESDDVRGFVKKELLTVGEEADKLVTETGEENMTLAAELIKPADNKACYYTITSIKEGSISSAIRESMINYASLFLGNPYVWGGTSLTNGCDCSGYVQAIYAQYGYSLPRTSAEQSQYGTKIAYADAAPGDLIFYARGGTVYHVLMYIGDGKAINAASSKTGIIISDVDTSKVVWATRIINDADSQVIDTVNAKSTSTTAYAAATSDQYGEKLGTFKLTAYCNCSICCGQWADGATASGTMPTQGRTVAMAGVPFGTKLIINGVVYTVEDRGTPYGHVDIFFNDHQEASDFGVQYADVYLAK